MTHKHILLRSPLWFALALALSGVGIERRASAHGVVMDYQSTDAIEVRGTYDSGEPMAGAQVAVYAPEDISTPWLTGTTDEQGVFLFKPDPSQPGTWEVQFRQAGHGDVLTIPVGDQASTDTATSRIVSRPDAGSLSLVQKLIVFGAMIWGFVGTALYFSSRRQLKSLAESSELTSTSQP